MSNTTESDHAQPLTVVRYVPQSSHTVDVLSFDPGTRNCGCVRIRVDRDKRQCCILNAALLDLLNPELSLSLAAARRTGQQARSRKPATVEPFSHDWPQNPANEPFRWTQQHRAALRRAQSLEQQDKANFPELMALVPHTLNASGWLCGADLDYVLIEVQDPQNAKMRSLAHAMQTYYELVNILQDRGTPVSIHFVSARLKLSDGVLNALDTALRFQADTDKTDADGIIDLTNGMIDYGNDLVVVGQTPGRQSAIDPSPLRSLSQVVNRDNHGKRKTSAKLVFDALTQRCAGRAPFLQWVERQRATKHNVLDALLQCWSWCLEQGVGFDAALLRTTRQQQQRAKAAARRARKRKPASSESLSAVGSQPARILSIDDDKDAAATHCADTSVQTAPKRRRVTLSRVVVPVELD